MRLVDLKPGTFFDFMYSNKELCLRTDEGWIFLGPPSSGRVDIGHVYTHSFASEVIVYENINITCNVVTPPVPTVTIKL